MERTITHKTSFWILFLLLLTVTVTGCSTQVAAETTTSDPGYTGALDTSYENALDPISQLALGMLNLEGTADAVTEPQAAALLPLWQVLQGSELQSDAERLAVTEQIEHKVSEAQATAIIAMQLTQADAQAWAGSESTMQTPPGEHGTGSRQIQEGMSEEQIAQMREQLSKQADTGATGGVSMPGTSSQGLIRAFVNLLGERAGEPALYTPMPPATTQPAPMEANTLPDLTSEAEEPVAQTPTGQTVAEAEPTSTPQADPDPVPTEAASEPVVRVVQAGDTLSAIARAYGVTTQAIATANSLTDLDTIHVGQALIIPDPTLVPASTDGADSALPVADDRPDPEPVPAPALKQLEDTQPGPPFTIEVSANMATQDSLIEASQIYKVTGLVRNDGDQAYAVSTIHITFYDAEGFRGTFTPAIRDGKVVGGEWHWHGETEADFAALLLAPGEVWPFSVEITAQDMASFLIHADAAPTGRASAPVALSEIKQIDDGTGYVRITGVATNTSPFEVKNVTVAGALLDAGGQIVSVGSTYVLQEDIAPGASVGFDLRIERASFESYQLYAQAERDWE